MNLHEFEATLQGLPAGQAMHVSYDMFSGLFPPGEPDEQARQRALQLAMASDCFIQNCPQKQELLFVKKLSELPEYGQPAASPSPAHH